MSEQNESENGSHDPARPDAGAPRSRPPSRRSSTRSRRCTTTRSIASCSPPSASRRPPRARSCSPATTTRRSWPTRCSASSCSPCPSSARSRAARGSRGCPGCSSRARRSRSPRRSGRASGRSRSSARSSPTGSSRRRAGPRHPALVKRLALELYLTPRRTPSTTDSPLPLRRSAPAVALQGRLRARHAPRGLEGTRRGREARRAPVRRSSPASSPERPATARAAAAPARPVDKPSHSRHEGCLPLGDTAPPIAERCRSRRQACQRGCRTPTNPRKTRRRRHCDEHPRAEPRAAVRGRRLSTRSRTSTTRARSGGGCSPSCSARSSSCSSPPAAG